MNAGPLGSQGPSITLPTLFSFLSILFTFWGYLIHFMRLLPPMTNNSQIILLVANLLFWVQNDLSNCSSTSSEISHRHYMACTMVSLNAPLNLKSTSMLTCNTPHGIYLILPLDCKLIESGHWVSVIWLFTVLNTVPSVK